MTNQLEEIVSEAYFAAYDALDIAERERLLALGLLGAPDHGLFTDWMLKKLARFAGPASLPAIQRWAKIPRPDAFSSQDATSSFLIAVVGCARLLDHPPEFGTTTGDDSAAWAAYGQILFWILRPGLTDAERRARCAPLWERLLGDLAFQAVDPLVRFAAARLLCPSKDESDGLGMLANAFPDEVRTVLTFGLRNHARLTTLFRHGPHNGYLKFLITWLGCLGDQQATPLLEAYLESPEVGLTAAEALRAIRSR